MEILVSTLIISLTLIGLANIFVAGKRYILHTRSRMAGGELGKYFLDPLQMSIRQNPSTPTAQDGWDQPENGLFLTPTNGRYCDSNLTTPDQTNCPSPAERTLHGIPYDARYDITPVTDTDLRRVKLTINWDETTP